MQITLDGICRHATSWTFTSFRSCASSVGENCPTWHIGHIRLEGDEASTVPGEEASTEGEGIHRGRRNPYVNANANYAEKWNSLMLWQISPMINFDCIRRNWLRWLNTPRSPQFLSIRREKRNSRMTHNNESRSRDATCHPQMLEGKSFRAVSCIVFPARARSTEKGTSGRENSLRYFMHTCSRVLWIMQKDWNIWQRRLNLKKTSHKSTSPDYGKKISCHTQIQINT